MELIPLGTGAAYPGPNQACSGYLVVEGDTYLQIDCGNGVVPRLQEAGALGKVTALVFSHIHSDHLLDIVPLFYTRYFAKEKPPRLPVFMPPPELARFREICAVLGVAPESQLEAIFDLQEYDPDRGLEIGPLRLSFMRTEHPIPTYAIRVTSEDRSMTFTADTGPGSGLVEFARNTDILLSEASVLEEDFDPARPIHLTPRMAAENAAQAGAGSLLLTHVWPLTDRQAMLEQVRKVFAATELAEELKHYKIG